MSSAADFTLLPDASEGDILGEGPWWSVAESLFYWVDIKGHRVRGSRLDGGESFSVPTPSDIGFAVPARAGGFVVALRDGLYSLDRASGTFSRLTDPGYDTDSYRINDGKTDRLGRLWYGTIHDAESVDGGFLYSYSEGRERLIRSGVTTSNGLGWSPDNSVFYYTDSMAFTITAYDFDFVSGDIANPREFSRDVGHRPDGLTVDSDGCVWSAKWNGGVVVRYDPDGQIMQTLRLPVSRPTSCMFVGEGLDILAVTSARPDSGGENEPLAGRVFLVDPGATGLPEVPFAG